MFIPCNYSVYSADGKFITESNILENCVYYASLVAGAFVVNEYTGERI